MSITPYCCLVCEADGGAGGHGCATPQKHLARVRRRQPSSGNNYKSESHAVRAGNSAGCGAGGLPGEAGEGNTAVRDQGAQRACRALNSREGAWQHCNWHAPPPPHAHIHTHTL